jgi:hypothetical protein
VNKKLALVVVVASLLLSSVVAAQSPGPGSGWWSGEQIQNVGTDPASIMLTAYDMDSTATYEASETVASGSAYTFLPTHFPGMPDGFVGSVVVSSDQPIKGIVNVTNQPATIGGVDLGVTGGMASAQYQGMDSPSDVLYFPLAKHDRYGNTTGFYIQNAGSAADTAVAVFSMDDGGVYTYTTPSVGAGQMVYIHPSMASVPTSNTGRANIGSLKVSASSGTPLAGAVFEQDTDEAVATVLFGTRGFTANDFDNKAYAPVVKNDRYGRFTGIQVQNVDTVPITVDINYVGTSPNCQGVTTQDVITVDPGKSTTAVSNQGNFTPNCTGAATLDGTGDFVAIVNETNLPGYSAAGIVYSAMADASATTKLSIPLFKDSRYGATSGLQIQNVGAADATNVVATFSCKGAAEFTAVSDPQTITAGGGMLFYKPYSNMASAFATPFAIDSVNCAVVVTSDQPVVAIVNETSTQTPAHLDDYNYEGFNLVP